MKKNKHTGLPLFSVIIPVYNKEPHIARCISSVLNQNFEDYEVIAVHDPSTDESLQELKQFEDDIQIIQRDKPGPGGYAARNVGIKRARGEWIAFLDADDEWRSNHLHSRYELIMEFPEADILSSGWLYNYGDDSLAENKYYQLNYKKGKHLIGLEKYLNSYISIWTSIVCIKKKKLIDVNGFDESWNHGADQELWLRLLLNGAKVAWSPVITAIYHRNSVNSVTSSFHQKKSPTSELIKRFLKKNPDHSYSRLLKKRSNKEAVKALLRGGVEENITWEEAKENLYFDPFIFRDLNQLMRILLVLIFFHFPKKLKQWTIKVITLKYNI